MTINDLFYEGAILISLAVSILLNICQFGWSLRWKRKAHWWKDQYYKTMEPMNPPAVVTDPYEGVKTALEYNWEEVWD
jgi:hypothetical protein